MTDPQNMSDAQLMAALGLPQAGRQPPRQAPAQDRGTRNANAGNLKASPWTQRQPGFIGQDAQGFAMFDSPQSGEAAQVNLLRTNYAGMSPAQVVNKYAPVGPENSPESVRNYIAYAARRAGVDPNAPIPDEALPTFAQAMREFETGQTADDVALTGLAQDTAPVDASGLSDEQLLAALLADAPRSPQAAQGASQDNPIDLTGQLYQDQVDALKQGAWVRAQNGEVYQLPGDAFTANTRSSDEAQGGNVFVRRPNLEDRIGAFASAASEQIPFSDELSALTVGALTGDGYDATREAQSVNRDLLNQTNRGDRVAGGVTGFATGFALPGAGYVNRGANTLQRMGRAAQIGAGYGALYGAGAEDGGLADRAQGAVVGAGLGAASGGLAQGGIDRFSAQAARAQAAPSASRRLSREGVDLTLGQMLQPTPVIGPMLRGAEDAASSVPFLGSAIQGARNQTTESFNRAALNRALRPIGESLPRRAEVGYEAVRGVQNRLSAAYDDVLPRVSAQLDQPLYDQIAEVLNRAAGEMEPERVRQLAQVLETRVFRNVDQADATLTGEQFKRIESELGALARQRTNAQDPSIAAFGSAVSDIQGALRDLIARQNPGEAARIRAINEGYANLTRIERAAGSGPALATEGVFTPTQLGQAVNQMGGGRSQGGRGDRLMQDLASAGRSVLPSTVGDSGTAARGAVTALIGGGAAGVLSPGLAVPVVATSLAYSRPAQAALNVIYRSTDQPGAVNKALSDLSRLARDNPALVPVYEAALLRSKLDAPSSAPEQRRASRGLFGARRPQAASQ